MNTKLNSIIESACASDILLNNIPIITKNNSLPSDNKTISINKQNTSPPSTKSSSKNITLLYSTNSVSQSRRNSSSTRTSSTSIDRCFSMPENSSLFSQFSRQCKIRNRSNTTIYCHITDNPNRLLLSTVNCGFTAGTSGTGVNTELTFDKSISITQTTRILNDESIVISLSSNKTRYLTAAWKDDDNIFWLRCISAELDRGHIYTFNENDLKDPIGFIKNFIP